MSLLALRSLRTVSRSTRRIHSATPYRNYLSEQEALQHHASGYILYSTFDGYSIDFPIL